MTPRRIDHWTRRAVDLIGGASLALLSVPIVIAVALVSAVCFRSWPFFVHERVGRSGRRFRLVKIRTLPPSTPQYVDKYALDIDSLPAITRWFRHSHVDELPQLWHVVSGKMSLIGPRPEMPRLHDELPAEFAEERLAVRPGCTGLWQISIHCGGLIGERPEYDSLYVRHRSWRLDLWIAYQTLRTVLHLGTIRLQQVPDWAMKGQPHLSAPTAAPSLQPATATAD